MLGEGYSMLDILRCYQHLKGEHFWADKSLAMMSVKGQIGEWKAWEGKERPRVSAPAPAFRGATRQPMPFKDNMDYPESKDF
jgi:hypothetical protein